MVQIFGTPKCKVTRAAQRFFADRGVPVQFVNLREKAMSKGELTSVARAVGGLRSLVDTASPRAESRGRELALATEARLTEILVAEPLLLKTPIVRRGSAAAVGAADEVWATFAAEEKAG